MIMRDAIREFYEYYYSSPYFKSWRDEFIRGFEMKIEPSDIVYIES